MAQPTLNMCADGPRNRQGRSLAAGNKNSVLNTEIRQTEKELASSIQSWSLAGWGWEAPRWEAPLQTVTRIQDV